MHVVVRSYSAGASELFDALEQRESEVRELIQGVPGFVSYVAFLDSDGGGTTITVCEDKAGTDESSRRAAEWVKENLTGSVGAPAISEGDTSLQF